MLFRRMQDTNLNEYWLIVNETLRNEFQWNIKQNAIKSAEKNFENAVC